MAPGNASASQSDAPLRVLIVDDQWEVRKLLGGILQQKHCSIAAAANIAEARTLVHNRRPQLVLLDLVLGSDDDALAFCSELKGEAVETPRVIVISALTGAESYAAARLCGADGYLPKPFTPNQVLGLIDLVDAWLTSPWRPFPDLWRPPAPALCGCGAQPATRPGWPQMRSEAGCA
jgi:CheY-like chemotaxis protein